MTDEKTELDVLLEQLEELIGAGATDVSDALEIATCAGLAMRLGATPEELTSAEAWRQGPGGPLLDELFGVVDVQPLVDAVEGLLGEDVEESVLEEAVFDFDDLVAAAIWCRRTSLVQDAARSVASTIRMAPDTFAALSPYGSQMSRLPAVGADYAVYDYWMALADC
jgi:hypothetical protein